MPPLESPPKTMAAVLEKALIAVAGYSIRDSDAKL